MRLEPYRLICGSKDTLMKTVQGRKYALYTCNLSVRPGRMVRHGTLNRLMWPVPCSRSILLPTVRCATDVHRYTRNSLPHTAASYEDATQHSSAANALYPHIRACHKIGIDEISFQPGQSSQRPPASQGERICLCTRTYTVVSKSDSLCLRPKRGSWQSTRLFTLVCNTTHKYALPVMMNDVRCDACFLLYAPF